MVLLKRLGEILWLPARKVKATNPGNVNAFPHSKNMHRATSLPVCSHL